ncbi:MAG: hypothetical protein EOO43_11985 [Flavobacterium sp.]|nr:MAG: hypothetical protein EOO43_11985 [Flavobacterium sp.]
MERRNLSGIYILQKIEKSDKQIPTCFEDCKEETQDEWLDSLDTNALKNLSKQLGKRLRTIGDQFDIVVE